MVSADIYILLYNMVYFCENRYVTVSDKMPLIQLNVVRKKEAEFCTKYITIYEGVFVIDSTDTKLYFVLFSILNTEMLLADSETTRDSPFLSYLTH